MKTPCGPDAEDGTAIAAVRILEDAGFRVMIPESAVCCGRPLYDYGFLGLARRYLRRTLATLREEIRAGVPVVGVEPSCVAVFKDELIKLWPMDQDARRLNTQTFHFSELLAQQDEWEPPQLHRKAILHGHCHQKATGGTGPDRQLLEAMGLEVEELDAGCCGMDGGWGYEVGHYDVSIACGERVLLPSVREAPNDALIVADGFSCRSQIEQAQTGRRALHSAQVLALARQFGPAGPPGPFPERYSPERPQPAGGRTAKRVAATVTAAAAVAAAAALTARATTSK